MSYRAFLLVAVSCAGHAPKVTNASSTVYARSDTDATTIISPTLQIAGKLDNATLGATYTVDAWTGASVDVVTAATKAIHEKRNEVDANAGYEIGVLALSANYRFSTERDYLSHGLTLGMRADLANKNTTIAFDLLGTDDRVGRAGDPMLSLPVRSLGGRLLLAQVIDRNTIAEVGWQTTLVDGYQASPYRFVAIGDLGTCDSNAPFCIPEQVPDSRLRNAFTVRARRALGRSLSSGLEYRFYFDDWGMLSQAIQPDLTWRPSDAQTISLRYRYSTQRRASFYRPRYFTLDDTNGYVTRDRKLSTLFDNELGLQYIHRIENEDGDRVVVWGFRATVSRADYLAFVGLQHVWAVESTALLGLEFP